MATYIFLQNLTSIMEKNFNVVNLNVGGKILTTYYDTLKRASYFQELIENKKGEQASVTGEDDNQTFFIDRDETVFEEVMYYLRSLEIRVDTLENLEKLKIEAKFFGVKELVLKVDQALQSINDEGDDDSYFLERDNYHTERIDIKFSGELAGGEEKNFIGKIQYKGVDGKKRIDIIVRTKNKNQWKNTLAILHVLSFFYSSSIC